eukprot:jgi/Undpi1/11987/HiC_scaffold_4.g01686.m1
MSRLGLWRPPRSSRTGDSPRSKLASASRRPKSERKRGTGVKRDFLSALRNQMGEDLQERWMRRRALLRNDKFTAAQRRELREWFDSLDRDGSGEIDCSELSHPLLSTGIARSAVEVEKLVREVDRDGSGEIGFNEFLAILQPNRKDAVKGTIAKVIALQEVKKAHGSNMEAVVAVERRSLLMKEILDEATVRDAAIDDGAIKRDAAEKEGDDRALRALRAREAQLEARKNRRNLFIQAVCDATDFEKMLLVLKIVVFYGGDGHGGDDGGGGDVIALCPEPDEDGKFQSMTKPSADGIAFGAVTRREISAGPSRVMTPPADRARRSSNLRGSSGVGSGGV